MSFVLFKEKIHDDRWQIIEKGKIVTFADSVKSLQKHCTNFHAQVLHNSIVE